MKTRCTNPNSQRWNSYGAKGVKVCECWLRSFKNFLADVGRKPTPQHSLGRFGDIGNYEPGNAVWMSREEQLEERRKKKAFDEAHRHASQVGASRVEQTVEIQGFELQ